MFTFDNHTARKKGETKKWFTSDLHHDHTSITKYTDRYRVTSAEEHNDWLRDIWNAQVMKGDIVYHVGDFSFSDDARKVNEFVNTLNGKIIFIKGNHDRTHVLDALTVCEYHEQHQYLEAKITKEQKAVMFHFPIASWHGQSRGVWHLHGHSHGNLSADVSRGKMLDVGIDNAYNLYGEFTFFDVGMIERYMETREQFIADDHRGKR